MSARTARRKPLIGTLLATQLVFNIGFYAVLPFLAIHLHDDLALSGTAIAVTVAVRTFCQQGLFVVGGALADRYGPRIIMVGGTLVRVSGYLALAGADTLPMVLIASALTGFGGALFSPALESLLANQGTAGAEGPSRSRLFALLAVCGETGALVGPLLGAALLGVGFAAAALTGAAIFAASAAVLWWMVPSGAATAGRRPADGVSAPTRSWRTAVTHRRYVWFCVAYSSYLLSYNQLYVALPVELDRTDAPDLTLALLFGGASLLVIIGQLPISAITRRFPARVVLPIGFAVLALAFVVVAVAAPRLPVTGTAVVVPAAVMVTLLVLGQMIVVPVAMTMVPEFAGGASLGAFYGLLATAGGTATLLGSFVIGPLLDLGRSAGPLAGVPWWAMATFPALSAVALLAILRPDPPYPPGKSAGRPPITETAPAP